MDDLDALILRAGRVKKVFVIFLLLVALGISPLWRSHEKGRSRESK